MPSSASLDGIALERVSCYLPPETTGVAGNYFFGVAARAEAAAALDAALVAAAMLVSASSTACLVALCTVSYVVLAALMADFITATAVSEPAGAFLATLSTSD